MVDYRDFFCGCLSIRCRIKRLSVHVLIVRVFIIVAVLLCVLKEINVTPTLRGSVTEREKLSIIKKHDFQT